MKRAVLVVGAAGAGKSTFINTVTETDEATVSHMMLTDGTSDLASISVPFNEDIVIIDTPGLNSANFSVSMTEKVQMLCPEKNLLIILVINKSNARITDYIGVFERVYDELVGTGKKFLIVWTHDSELTAENRIDVQSKFRGAIMCDGIELDAIKTHLSDPSLYSPQKRNIFRPPPPPPRAAPNSVSTRAPTTIVPSVPSVPSVIGAAGPRMPGALRLNLPPTVGVQHLAEYSGAVPARFLQFVKATLKIKQDGGPEYRNKRLMGDANLKPIVMAFLVSVEEDTTLESLTLLLLGNDADCPMPRFFEKYFKAEYVKVYRTTEEYGSSHHHADLVEVLLELSRSKKKGGAIFVFIIMELFKLAGLQRVVDKVKNLCA